MFLIYVFLIYVNDIPNISDKLRFFLFADDTLEKLDKLISRSDLRFLKKKVVGIQAAELLKRMMVSSKMDKVIFSGFCFDGSMMRYLSELNLKHARAIFMSRYRMWPTKANYPGRWKDCLCNVCGMKDTDYHIFRCPGYSDIIKGQFTFDIFWDKPRRH